MNAKTFIMFPCRHERETNHYISKGILRCPQCNRTWLVQNGTFSYELPNYVSKNE